MTILNELKAGIRSASPEETEEIGRQVASALPDNVILSLSGDLGTGKTTLVRGLARGLGITAAITSPTYTIYTTYAGTRQLVHMDAYRLSGSEDLDSLTIDEFLKEPFIIALEWPEQAAGLLEEYPVYSLILKLEPDHRHLIRLK